MVEAAKERGIPVVIDAVSTYRPLWVNSSTADATLPNDSPFCGETGCFDAFAFNKRVLACVHIASVCYSRHENCKMGGGEQDSDSRT